MMRMQTIKVRYLLIATCWLKVMSPIGPSFTLVPIDESTILGDHAEADEER